MKPRPTSPLKSISKLEGSGVVVVVVGVDPFRLKVTPIEPLLATKVSGEMEVRLKYPS